MSDDEQVYVAEPVTCQSPRASADPTIPQPAHPLRPEALPEDIALAKLQECTALQASFDFVRALGIPGFLLEWVKDLSQTRPTSDFAHLSAQEYVERIFNVALFADLCVEVVVNVDHSETVYPFGLANRIISIPSRLFEHNAAMMSYLNRMLLLTQAEPTSKFYSSDGGAFARYEEDVLKHRAHWSQFHYNALLDFYFPRFQFVVAYVASDCAVMRTLDATLHNMDVDKVLATGFEDVACPDVSIATLVEYMRSETATTRLLVNAVLRDIVSTVGLKLSQRRVRMERMNEKGERNPIDIPSRMSEREMRRADFFLPYLGVLRHACETFSTKRFLCAWSHCQNKINAAVKALYPINFRFSS